jgi:hypothetical protein
MFIFKVLLLALRIHSILYLRRNEFVFMPFLSIALDKVGKEKNLEHKKNNGQFNKNDSPEGPAKRHVSETIRIEVVDSIKKITSHEIYFLKLW